MSICTDKKNRKYYISYQIKMPNGTYKTFNIRNKNWTLAIGKKYMKSIEAEEIEKDYKKRKIIIHEGNSVSLNHLIDMYFIENEIQFKPQTLYNKKIIINKYIKPYFNVKENLEKSFTLSKIESFKQSIITEKEISTDRKNKIFNIFKELLEYAIDHEYISYEIYRKLTKVLKKIRIIHKKKEDKLLFWTNEQWDLFYATFEEDDKWRLLFKVTYYGALRIGELLALKWKCFDANKGTIYIHESIDSLGNSMSTKTMSSDAIVQLPKTLVDELKKFKEENIFEDNDYVFFGTKRTSRTTIRRIMKEHIDKSGVPFIKFHGLRHSCASRLINAGISPLLVSKHLRHSSTQETLDTYSHLFPSATIGFIDSVFEK